MTVAANSLRESGLRTVMVSPESVQYEEVAPQYTTVQRTQMVAPAQTVMVPVRPRCGNCGY